MLTMGCAVEGTDTNDPSRTDATSTDPTAACGEGESYQWPGCEPEGASTAIVEGCYASCSGASDVCDGGLTCTQAWVNPCVCPKGEGCCAACGAEQWLCLQAPTAR